MRDATGAIRRSITQSLRQAFDAGSRWNPARSATADQPAKFRPQHCSCVSLSQLST
ncbi:hypothetical protein ACXC9Q_28945 [Kribbella sp. CWNU-51]